MLAVQCRSIATVFKKFPNGAFSEFKYDGERVQVHKVGETFRFFSRSLKTVPAKKLGDLEKYLNIALPKSNTSYILDCEMLMIDTVTGKFLPFEVLGVNKRKSYKHSEVCLVVFDCMYMNNHYLYMEPLVTRRKILEQNITPIHNKILLSEQKLIYTPQQLLEEFKRALSLNMEGLMLKCVNSCYLPGKRRWLKLKRDYFINSADSADLIILGAWYGTGRLRGLLSVFLVGCQRKDPSKRITYGKQTWIGVTKVHAGLNDSQLIKLNDILVPLMTTDGASTLDWRLESLDGVIRKPPPLIAKDPRLQPVLEVVFTEVTANMSFRFPRVACIRYDKDWKDATTFDHIQELTRGGNFNKVESRMNLNNMM